MSIFDDIPLPVGTEYYEKTIIDWDAENQKYLVEQFVRLAEKESKWLPRALVERHHSAFCCEGVETRESKPGNSYNTRYFRSKT